MHVEVVTSQAPAVTREGTVVGTYPLVRAAIVPSGINLSGETMSLSSLDIVGLRLAEIWPQDKALSLYLKYANFGSCPRSANGEGASKID